MLYRIDVLMRWVVTICAGSRNLDFRLGFGLGGLAPYVCGLEHCGEALARRRRDAFRRAFIVDRLMGVRTPGTEVIHGDSNGF